MTVNNLGLVYRRLSEVSKREFNLKKAIAAYQEAIKVRDVNTSPVSYGVTQNNLSLAYKSLSVLRDKKNNLQKAVEAFSEALKVYKPRKFPSCYEQVKKNLETTKQMMQ